MQPDLIGECPVLRPTLKEFTNFRRYVENLDRTIKQRFGMVKTIQIIPPKSWVSRAQDYSQRLRNVTINSPIEQNTFGKGGIYECLHIPKKSMSFPEFAIKARQFDHLTEGRSAQEVEEMFWKNVTFSAPLYGADMLTSLMDQSSGGWNLNNLDSILRDGLENTVKGVNTPYCYFGTWKAFFAWHTQDLDLSGVNYIHQGKSKFWYAVHYQDKHIVEREAMRLFPQHFSSCRQFLRHKTTLINPYYLKRKYPELRISKIEHRQHEMMVVFGGAYHTGFNFGFNVAEAINYATTDWLAQLVQTKPCTCLKTSVQASIYQLYKNLLLKPEVTKTNQFKIFQEHIFQKVEQESESEREETKKEVRSIFSRKIRKNRKAPRKIVYQDEEYDIQQWAQCQQCQQWRVVTQSLAPKDQFFCSQVGKTCYKKEKIGRHVIQLQN